MELQHIYIKNMVCNRCIKVVKEDLRKFGLEVEEIKLGEAIVKGLDDHNYNLIKKELEKDGFEIIDDKKTKIIENVKTLIITLVHSFKIQEINTNISTFIEQEIGFDYNYISSLFSSMESVTLEKYIILQKIEKVKELIVYNELTLSEIAYKLGYSSVHHLSNQFKKITGLSPTHFKNIKEDKRNALDKVGSKL